MATFLIIACVYPPEPIVAGWMSQDLARHLAGDGHNVTVICPFPSRPIGENYPGYKMRDTVNQRIENGVTVARVPAFNCPVSNLWGRFHESLSFGRASVDYFRKHPNIPDAIFDMSWPIIGQDIVSRAAKRLGIPLVLNVQDIYPECLLRRLPAWIAGTVGLVLRRWDRAIALRARRLVVISENMRQTYVNNRGIAPQKVVTVLNWVDEDRYEHLPARSDACVRYKIPEDRFTFLYLGNVGRAAGVQRLIEGFHGARLKKAQLVIAGDGSDKALCVERAKRLGVDEVRFITDAEFGNVPLIQGLSHVCLLALRKGASMSSIPSKLISYLLSAKPVLATVDAASDTARCIREAQCGWVGEPENVGWLAQKMSEVAKLPAEALSIMGQKGRVYGLHHFSKTKGVERLACILKEAAGRGKAV